LSALATADEQVNIFNLGTASYCEVRESVAWICGSLGVSPQIEYGTSESGWIGDNPFIFLDTRKIRSLGWRPRHSIREGIVKTLDYLRANPWVLKARQ
jgi:UDP-glucose 4-epimerase